MAKRKRIKNIEIANELGVEHSKYSKIIEAINITEDIKKHFQIAINKYYLNNKKIYLTETYKLMLRDFYSDIYKENGEFRYRLWDKSKIPTYKQFYYWFNKTKNIKKDITKS